jgi:hypothetical protein
MDGNEMGGEEMGGEASFPSTTVVDGTYMWR